METIFNMLEEAMKVLFCPVLAPLMVITIAKVFIKTLLKNK